MSRAPVVAVGAIVRRGDDVLLVLRGTPPNQNQWAIPGGRLNLGESLQQAAEREILEETGIQIKAGDVVFTFEHIERDADGAIRFHYVVLDLAADYLSGEPHAGDDASDARWIPLMQVEQWPVNSTTLRALRQLFPEFMR
jgi:ADP-ribose pyrophosphatase